MSNSLAFLKSQLCHPFPIPLCPTFTILNTMSTLLTLAKPPRNTVPLCLCGILKNVSTFIAIPWPCIDVVSLPFCVSSQLFSINARGISPLVVIGALSVGLRDGPPLVEDPLAGNGKNGSGSVFSFSSRAWWRVKTRLSPRENYVKAATPANLISTTTSIIPGRIVDFL
jgi:hypothetical protein